MCNFAAKFAGFALNDNSQMINEMMKYGSIRLIKIIALSFIICLLPFSPARAQMTVAGIVTDDESKQPVEFASILMKENGRWAITDSDGRFTIKGVPQGKATLSIQCLGYARRELQISITKDIPRLKITLKQENLKLGEVTVTARRKSDEATTSYTIDRTALDQQQILNVSDVSTLLPGGKTVNPSLTTDTRMALRSGNQEGGNASFGTAIEVDGVRLDNNAMTGETAGASTRTISASNIESVEIVTGIPSVEYGDLSNGVVKVNTRRGKSPFIIEGKLNQHTRQIALNKGFDLGHRRGVLNVSLEHARSFTDAASPHTAYQRNIVSLNYMNIFMQQTAPLTLNIGLTGNLGGYNSEADPDEHKDDYIKVRDNNLRGHFDLNWLINKSWLTNLSMKGSFALADKRTENYYSANSASTQPYLHTMEEGYAIAQDYDLLTTAQGHLQSPNPSPLTSIILGPTGYWYVKGWNDSKPMSWSLRLKADWHHNLFPIASRLSPLTSHLKAGIDYNGSRNDGRGQYYDDMRYAPTWREYRLDNLPTMHNLAVYAEEKITVPTTKLSTLELTAGLRDDITMIKRSAYGTVSSLSPRVNGRYIFWRNLRKRTINSLIFHAGWGKSVKLPSFQVLYPTPAYADRLAFASTSTSDNTSFYAYHTYPTQAIYNPSLKWQYTNQADLGVEITIKGTRITLSAFHHKTYRSYTSMDVFTPMTYKYTAPSALNGITLPAEDRRFDIDKATGVVTLYDASGQKVKDLTYTERNTYAVNNRYDNGSPVTRYGLEWTVDFAQIKPLYTSIRIDGNYYQYKGLDETLFADIPLGVNSTMTGNKLYQYVGWYRGSNVTTAGSSATASVSNGLLQRFANNNVTVTTHLPRLRMIISLRVEASLYNYRRQLSEFTNGSRGYVLESASDYLGEPYDGTSENKYVAVYPEYYTTWDDPERLIPFEQAFRDAKENNLALYNDLSKLVVRSNYPYTMNANRTSSYWSANLSITKEIGDHVSVSFYANNFLNNMSTVHSSQTDLETSLFGSSYIPNYYYGLSLRLKL